MKDDKDLVHEFVNNQGLQCLIEIGRAADQNYQNYILRGREIFFDLIIRDKWFLALGQLMLYVDGMNAVINQNEVVQWLYSLIESSVWRKEKSWKSKSKMILFSSFDLLLKQV